MNILCKLFGHKPPVYAEKGWWSPGEEYASIELGAVDGINRQHASVIGKCARCGRNFTIAMIHIPRLEKEKN